MFNSMKFNRNAQFDAYLKIFQEKLFQDFGSDEERKDFRLIGKGEGIHWPQLDEDIGVEGPILGKPPEESQRSLKRWLGDCRTI